MDMMQAVRERHSVRSYIDRPIEQEKLEALRALIDECNADAALNIQLVTNEPRAFSGFLTRRSIRSRSSRSSRAIKRLTAGISPTVLSPHMA